MRNFPKDTGNCHLDFPRKQIKLLRITEKCWWRKQQQKDGGEMSNDTTHAQNWVFKHNTRKTSRNNKIKKILDHISTWQASFRKHSNIEKCLKNLELLSGLLDQKLIDFDEERINSYEKYDVKKYEKAKVEAQLFRNRADLESPKSGISEGEHLIRELHSEIAQCMQKLAVSHSRLKVWDGSPRAPTESPEAETKSPPRDLEPAQSPTTSWVWPRAVPTKKAFKAESRTKFGSTAPKANEVSLILRISQSRNAVDWWIWGCQKCWWSHDFSIFYRKTDTGLRESWCQDCKRSRQDLNRETQETSYHSRRKSSIWEAITNGLTDCLGDPRLLSKFVATIKPSWTSEIYRMSNWRNTNVQAFDTKGDEVLWAVTDRPTDNILEICSRCKLERRKSWNMWWKSTLKRETTVGDKKYDCCRSKLLAHRHLEQKIKYSQVKASETRRGQTCNRSSKQRKKQKGKAK